MERSRVDTVTLALPITFQIITPTRDFNGNKVLMTDIRGQIFPAQRTSTCLTILVSRILFGLGCGFLKLPLLEIQTVVMFPMLSRYRWIKSRKIFHYRP